MQNAVDHAVVQEIRTALESRYPQDPNRELPAHLVIEDGAEIIHVGVKNKEVNITQRKPQQIIFEIRATPEKVEGAVKTFFTRLGFNEYVEAAAFGDELQAQQFAHVGPQREGMQTLAHETEIDKSVEIAVDKKALLAKLGITEQAAQAERLAKVDATQRVTQPHGSRRGG